MMNRPGIFGIIQQKFRVQGTSVLQKFFMQIQKNLSVAAFVLTSQKII
jgi:hypothetical protein